MPVRKVSNRGGNATGRFPSLKMRRMIAFESLLERDFVYLLDFDAAVEWFEEQPLTIEYEHAGKLLHYTPDFHLVEGGRQVLVECKPEHFVATAENSRKFAAARVWCQAQGWEFRVITDQQVRSGYRLENVKLLTSYARQHVDPVMRCQLYACLQGAQSTTSIQDIARSFSSTNPAAVTACILHLAYHHELGLPLDAAPISAETTVSLRHQAHQEEWQ